MDKSEVILKRQSVRTRFKNDDMDFVFTWVLGIGETIGMAHGEIFAAATTIKDGDPVSWRAGFHRQADFLATRAQEFARVGNDLAAGQSAFGSAFARRAAMQYQDPTDHQPWARDVKAMEDAFQQGARYLRVPIRPVSVPFENGSLPGYYLEHDQTSRPTVLMVGGGDTFREDLFYFAGYPGWKRGYNVLMVDLPGQGNTPADGWHFRVDADQSISACLDWLESNAAAPSNRCAVFGVSGGGYFTAQAAAVDPRICAWVASTPITDIGLLFERELGAALRAPSWLVNLVTKVAGSVNKSADLSLKKYAWQFGTSDFTEAVGRVRAEALRVPAESITCPALFLVGDSEAAELKRQTAELHDALARLGRDVTIHHFSVQDGADAHCQVNNLRLAHLVVFDWLDRVFDYAVSSSTVDPRVLC
jgi:alpha-beta hydrolase superfamily lysophospholipase/uncharacterized protein YukE